MYDYNYKKQLNDLISVDKKRFKELTEIIQYSIIYIIVCLIFGIILNKISPDPDENEKSYIIFIDLIIQSILISLCVYYIRKMCHLIPPFFNINTHTYAYNGDIMIAIIFFTTQTKIPRKIDILHKRFKYKI
tara:strand:+ start:919 stop:1314 length:396 start_codon:yes stop_codon:yes gene_type:complete